LIPALLLIRYEIVFEVVPRVTDWEEEPLNSIVLAVEVLLSVIVPPVWLNVPNTFNELLDELEAKSTVPALIAQEPQVKVPAPEAPTIVVPEDECVNEPATLTVPEAEEISHALLPETVIFPSTLIVPEETHLNFCVPPVAWIVKFPCTVALLDPQKLYVPDVAPEQFQKIFPKDCTALVGAAAEVVNPDIVKLDDAPHVANGIHGAPEVAPETLYADPFANTKDAADPVTLPFVEMLEVAVLFIIPVLVTVTTVPVPPVVRNEFEVVEFVVVPETVNVPAIVPVIPVPVTKPIEMIFDVFVNNIELPDPIFSSSPTDPDKLKTLWVVVLDWSVTAVLLVTCNEPIVWPALILIVPAKPAVVPIPSIIRISVVAGPVLWLPVLSAAVFQFAAVFQSAPEAPTQ